MSHLGLGVIASLTQNSKQWVGMNDNLVFLALHFMISKLYANSFLATYAFYIPLRERPPNVPWFTG